MPGIDWRMLFSLGSSRIACLSKDGASGFASAVAVASAEGCGAGAAAGFAENEKILVNHITFSPDCDRYLMLVRKYDGFLSHGTLL